ncbi:MAG: hypothetical protein WCK78_14820 [Paludibacter sp.]
MKKKVANYCIGLLFFVGFYGLYEAYHQNKVPFNTKKNESLDMTRNKENIIKNNESFKIAQNKY